MATPESNSERPEPTAAAVARTRAGFPTHDAQALARTLQLDHVELATLLGISPRTLDRRIGEAGRLGPIESDRLARAWRVIRRAGEVFDQDSEKTRGWLKTANRALGGETPQSLLDTDAGVEAVMAVLDRIDFGIYA